MQDCRMISIQTPLYQRSVTTNQTQQVMPGGKARTVSTPSVTTAAQVVNPKQAILETNNKMVERLRDDEQKWMQKKQSMKRM